MTYEVWIGANRLGGYGSREAALDVVHEVLNANGTGIVELIILGVVDDAGESHLIARGRELLSQLPTPA